MQGAANPDGLDRQKTTDFVDALTQFDRRMNQVVVDSGILKGIPKGRLRAAGKRPLHRTLVTAYSSHSLSQSHPWHQCIKASMGFATRHHPYAL